MRTACILLAVGLLGGAAAMADCPPDCIGSGGPPDCLFAWSGIASTTVSCTDGDPACDTDGKVDGVCTLALQACINVEGCTPSGLDGPPNVKPAGDPVAQQLRSALQTLVQQLPPGAPGCTPPGLTLQLKVSLAGIKAAKSHVTVTASSGGKHDRDKLRLTCQPGTPSFAQAVQPILTNRCAYSGCHDAATAHNGISGNLVLDAGVARDNLVGVHSTLGKLSRVKPGSIRGSEMARRILGQGFARGGLPMPQGCPGVVPPRGCLTDPEKFTILSWIAHGAPSD